MISSIGACLVTLVGFQLPEPVTSAYKPRLIDRCIITAIEPIQIPAKQSGLLINLDARPGQRVNRDQQLGRIDDRDAIARRKVAQAELVLAQSRASNHYKVEAAQKAYDYAKKEREMNERLFEMGKATAQMELDQSILQQEQKELEWLAADLELKEAQHVVSARTNELAIATRDVEDRQIMAPRDGIVQTLVKHENEWVQQGETILQMVRLDRLQAEMLVPSSVLPAHEISGCQAVLIVQVGPQTEQAFHLGMVKYISAEYELDGKYMIWVDVENVKVKDRLGQEHWLLRPGMEARMEIFSEPPPPTFTDSPDADVDEPVLVKPADNDSQDGQNGNAVSEGNHQELPARPDLSVEIDFETHSSKPGVIKLKPETESDTQPKNPDERGTHLLDRWMRRQQRVVVAKS